MRTHFKIRIALFVIVLSVFLSLLTYLANMDKIPSAFKGQSSAKGQSTAQSSAQAQVYRWQDKDGHWHFSDQEPKNGAAQVMKLDMSANIIESAKQAKPVAKEAPAAAPTVPSIPVLSPTQAAKALEQAKQVQGLMDNRQRQLDAAIER